MQTFFRVVLYRLTFLRNVEISFHTLEPSEIITFRRHSRRHSLLPVSEEPRRSEWLAFECKTEKHWKNIYTEGWINKRFSICCTIYAWLWSTADYPKKATHWVFFLSFFVIIKHHFYDFQLKTFLQIVFTMDTKRPDTHTGNTHS